MAKNKPADNQFTQGEKYLARIITARWTSLPTVGPNEAGLAIQIKLSVLCTAPTNGDPTFCGLEVVVFLPITIGLRRNGAYDNSRQRTIRISDIGRNFLNDFGISDPQYPKHETILSHNGAGIICEFGPTDPVNGYQSILKWALITDDRMQGLITTAIKAGARPPRIIGLKFPKVLVVTRYGETVLRSKLHWHALKLLAQNNSYNGDELVRDAWTNANKEPPDNTEHYTTYQLISTLNAHLTEHIKKLRLKIENDRCGNYTLIDLTKKSRPGSHRHQ